MKDKAAQEMARKRSQGMTAERRKEIAKGAAAARWKVKILRGRGEPHVARCSKHKELRCSRCQ